MEVVDDVAEDVHASQVERAKRRAVRAADGGSRDRVDLFDGVVAGRHLRQQLHHAIEREVVADEVRRVLRDHHALAQPVIGEVRDRLDD